MREVVVIEMYEVRKEYKEKDEIKYHPPEWIRILREYCRKDYGESGLDKTVQQKNKKRNVEDLL